MAYGVGGSGVCYFPTYVARYGRNSVTELPALVSNGLRVVWFGFVVQTILSVVVLEVITVSGAYDAAYAYGMQIALLSSLACVFVVIGVDLSIYQRIPAFQATGAGCLILAIVDLLWVIYFTSPPQSPVARLSIVLAEARNPAKGEPESYGKVEKIGRSTDAFALSPIHGGSAQRVMSGVPTMAQPDGATLSRPNAIKLWSSESARRTVTSAASVGGAAQSASPASNGSDRAISAALPEPQSEPVREITAEALFDCKFDF